MIEFKSQKEEFAQKFAACQTALSAIGDNTRQLIIKYLMEHVREGGVRVGDIQKNTNISRTAVSHHIKILKDAGIITLRKEGRKNYYFIDVKSSSLRLVIEFWKNAEEMMKLCKENRED